MELLGKYVYAPDAFETDYALFPYLQRQRRGFNFFSSTEDYKPQNTFRSIQVSTLSHILHPTTLARISNSSLYGNEYAVTDVMQDLTTNIFAADLGGNVNLIRQNLQTDYVRELIGLLGIGRASLRVSVCQYEKITVVAVSVKKKKHN